MKYISAKRICTLAALFSFMYAATPCQAYVINGLLDDWSIDLSQATSRFYLDSNTPTGGLDVDVATEDNADATKGTYYGAWYVGPEYSLGNMCDAEAMYFDNDDTNAYIAIVQGLPVGGSSVPAGWTPSYIWPGDIAIDANNDNKYEYGLDILSNTSAVLKKNGSWSLGQYSKTPYRVSGGQTVNTPLSFAFSNTAINGHYVMEASIPLQALGLDALSVRNLAIHWTMSCGNDYLTLNADVNPVPVPEPGSMMLLCTGFLGSLITFARRKYETAKRIFDIIGSGLALIVLSPVMLICAIAIKLDSRGPVFHKQVRVGIDRRKSSEDTEDNAIQAQDRRTKSNLGRLFTIYKLRTMRVDAELSSGAMWAQKNDNRITRVGNILRKTHLDEIPQFYNVLKGDMSIIGPRPERPVFVNKYKNYFDGRCDVKPGITGLAQVRQSYASSFEETKKKLKYDKLYIRKQSMVMDAQILFNTVGRVIYDRGAH